jgi:Tat protein secretion system quality control protein TatD with DNase activity
MPITKNPQIGINLADPVYNGTYYHKPQHASDLADVVARAQAFGCMKMMVTASDLESARKALEVAEMFRESDTAHSRQGDSG